MQQTPSPMPYRPRARRSKRWLVVAGAGAALVAYALFGRGAAPPPKAPAPASVSVISAEQGDVPIMRDAIGSVVAVESVAIRPRLDSQLVGVHFKDGQYVSKGDLLFTLDDTALRAQAAQLAATIARDKATKENAAKQKSRALALAEQGFVTKATRDDTIASAAVAGANVEASMAALANVRAQLGYTRITAPISGRTGTIHVTVGNTVKPGDAAPLVTINQLSPIRVQASLPQQLFSSVQQALRTTGVAVQALDQDTPDAVLAEGRLDYVDNAVDPATSTFVTRAHFVNADTRLWPGMFVNLRLNLGTDHGVITVPEVAIQHGQQGDYVYVVEAAKAAKRAVTVQRITQSGLAIVSKGLAAGEQVITDGLLAVTDGASVNVKVPAPAQADGKKE